MRLSDIMSRMGLASYAEVGLVLFLFVFAAVVLRTVLLRKADVQTAAHLPLDDGCDTPMKMTPTELSQESLKSEL